MARMTILEYMAHHGFTVLDMSRIILTIASVNGSIVRIVDNTDGKLL